MDYTVYDYLYMRNIEPPSEWSYDRIEEEKRYTEDRLNMYCTEYNV